MGGLTGLLLKNFPNSAFLFYICICILYSMRQSEIISIFPQEMSIPDRVLLVKPSFMHRLIDIPVQECRVFLLVSAGGATVKIGSGIVDVKENVLVDMLVWEPITFVSFTDNLNAWCILPNYLFTNESLNGLKPADSESFKDRHEIPMLHLESDEMRKLCRHLEMLADSLADFSNYYRIELCQTYFRSFMLEAGNLVRHKKRALEDAERVENRQDTILRSFLKLVWRYYKSEHNIDFYAQRLCISSKHLSRVVKDRLGKTPYAVIRDELLQQATEMLNTSKKSIQDISSELHFSEVASFCKFFKKHTGQSPTAYRSHRSANVFN